MNRPNDEAKACPCCGSDGPRPLEDGCSIGGGLCVYCYMCSIAEDAKSIPVEGQDSVSDVSGMSDDEGGCPLSAATEVPEYRGMDRCSGGTSVGGSSFACLSSDERPHKRQCCGLSRSRGSEDGEEVPRELPLVQDPQIGSTILYEGKQLHIEHGSDGDIEGDLEASESLSEGGEAEGSDYSSGDEGNVEDARDYIARWDCWKQTVFDRQEWPDMSLFFQ